LLQGAQSFVFAARAAEDRLCIDDPAKAMLEDALRKAEATIMETSHRIHDLRGGCRESSDLPALLNAVGVDLASAQAIRFTCAAEGVARKLLPLALDEAFLIGREALLNAFKHSHATAIELAICHRTDGLRLSVRDNGRGIPSEVLERGNSPGHWGLRGMNESADRIRARLQVRNLPAQGTEIELCIDEDAFQGTPDRHPSPRKRHKAQGPAIQF